jgi:asparagine synthase (glutamine-hydrolysing)
MCGITGALSFAQSEFLITTPYITKMRDTMEHRGPDGAGVWVSDNGKIGLGHRRLSIIDLSETANQPMGNEDGTIQLVFNGEIYNHADIRRELEQTGKYVWTTDHSDTEVILHSYEEWGRECLHRFCGMFAIALWDERIEELWLVRDRMGIKPLYYAIHHGRIVFASEIKAILEDSEQPRSVNEEGLFNYLTYLFVPAPQTLFEGIYKLPTATWLRVAMDGVIHEERYWDALDNIEDLSGESEENIATRLIAELRTSVKSRKVSDVPVGIFLSGGIDSSINAALFSEDDSGTVNTFSIAYDNNYASAESELDYAKLVANKVGAIYHEELLCEEDLLSFLPKMVHLQDEPIADPVCVPVYYVSKLARDNGIIVCQVGEGADELFLGYPSWLTRLRAQQLCDLPVPRMFRKIFVRILGALNLNKNWKYEYLRRDAEGRPIFWGGSGVFLDHEKTAIFSKRIKEKFKNKSSWDAISAIRQRFELKSKTKDHLSWMTYLDLNARLPDLLLMRVDKMSMGVSLEGRVPFLDHKLVEFAMSIPTRLKAKEGVLKYILKKAARDVIPDEVIDRKKQGFAAPVTDWLSGKLGEVVRNEVQHFCNKTDLFEWEQVKQMLERKSQYHSWQLLNLAIWWRTYIESGETIKNLKLLTSPTGKSGAIS